VASILANDFPSRHLDLVIVDSAPSSDATYAFCRSHEANQRLQYVRVDCPGASRARNRGAEVGSGSILAFTDDDTVVDRNWLVELAAAFADPTVAVATGSVLPLEIETEAQGWFTEYGGFTHGFTPVTYDLHERRPANPLFPYSGGLFGGSGNVAIRRESFLELGGFDHLLGAGVPARGGEDHELFVRALLAGHALAFAPSAIVRHLDRRDYAGLRDQIYGYGAGLSAWVARLMTKQPSLLPGLIMRVPRAVRYLLDPTSAKNAHRTRSYPRRLAWLELVGVVAGPFLVARGGFESWLRRYASR
jgi:GT2 family glycosyltransferase